RLATPAPRPVRRPGRTGPARRQRAGGGDAGGALPGRIAGRRLRLRAHRPRQGRRRRRAGAEEPGRPPAAPARRGAGLPFRAAGPGRHRGAAGAAVAALSPGGAGALAGDARMRAMDHPEFTAAALAERFSLQLQGDGATPVRGVATLASAGPGQLASLATPRSRGQLATSAAAVVVVRAEDAGDVRGTALIARDPCVAFARISALFERVPARAPGIHPSAVVDPTAEVSPD